MPNSSDIQLLMAVIIIFVSSTSGTILLYFTVVCNPACMNGACVDGACECYVGWMGEQCETLNHCDPNPCQYGTQCVCEADGYWCDCPAGYEGQNCDDINECEYEGPCLNGGICINTVGSYTCECVYGFEGENCQTPPTGESGIHCTYKKNF